MPQGTCEHCGGPTAWKWCEAFDKFGFGDGDANVYTSVVAEVLNEAGYAVDYENWGLHNVIITSVRRNGVEQIPARARIGYDDPRAYLPRTIVALLDARLPDEA